ncbi:MAG: hypothetical protein Q8Q15_03360 [bacterium]|nr:hypothetical protein [bacterium]
MEPSNDENHLNLFKRRARFFSLVAMFLIIAAIPFTVYVAQQRQEVRQQAAYDNGWGGNSTSRCGFGISCPTGQTCVNYHCEHSTPSPTLTSIPATPTPTSTSTPSPTPTCIPYPSPPACATTNPPTCYLSPPNPDLNFCPPSSTPSVSPSLTPTLTPTPTPISGGGTQLAFELVLPGVGPNGGNQNLKKPKRELRIQVFDVNNKEVANKSSEITFDPQSQTFKGTVDLGTAVLGEQDQSTNQWGGWPWPTSRHSPTPTSTPVITTTTTPTPTINPPSPGGKGNYVVKVKTKRYLRKIISGVTILNIGTLNQMPVTTMIVGDINDDNKLTIEDYNILVGCFASKADTGSCTDKENADLDDNDAIDGIDLNLFLRSLSTQEGD